MAVISSPKLITGGIFKDERGAVSFVNDFDMTSVKRFYQIKHKDIKTVRAWQGHKIERKWFYCTAGSFLLNLIKIDDWKNPSSDLIPETFVLKAGVSNILSVPSGYANGFKALEENSTLMTFSDQSIDEAKTDDFRFDKNYWFNWSTL